MTDKIICAGFRPGDVVIDVFDGPDREYVVENAGYSVAKTAAGDPSSWRCREIKRFNDGQWVFTAGTALLATMDMQRSAIDDFRRHVAEARHDRVRSR